MSLEHELLAPTLLRSQAFSALHGSVHRGELPADEGLARLERIRLLPIRLLGDAVLRRRGLEGRRRARLEETDDAEYVALTLLQGDALVTRTTIRHGRRSASSKLRRSRP